MITFDKQIQFAGSLHLATDSPQQLRPCDVDRVMSDCAALDVEKFREWLLSFELQPETKLVIQNWTPE